MRTDVAGTALALVAGLASEVMAGGPPLAHFYVVNEPPSVESLERHAARIGLASPAWFSVDASGSVASSVDAAVVRAAAERGVPLMPLLVNRGFAPEVAHGFLASDEARSRALRTLLDAATTHRFQGLQLDFENVPEDDRARYVEFVRASAKQLHKRHMRLSVAIPAPLAPLPAGAPGSAWAISAGAAGFDVAALAKAADFISLMAYDEHAAPGDPGPVAGRPWVEACLLKTLASVPAKKLMLGIPFYYRQWMATGILEGPYVDARDRAERHHAAILLDAVEREKVFSVREGDAESVAWLQDAESLKERLALVRKHSLRGFSAWRLGQEDPAFWDQMPERRR